MINIIGIVCLILAIQMSDPWKWLMEKIWSDKYKLYTLFLRLISCPMCLSFWIILIITLNPLFAGIGFVLSKILCNQIWK